MLMCYLTPAPYAEWPGSFKCRCGKTGVERLLNKSQHKKLTLEKKMSPAVRAETWPRNLSITSPTLYQQAIPLPSLGLYVCKYSCIYRLTAACAKSHGVLSELSNLIRATTAGTCRLIHVHYFALFGVNLLKHEDIAKLTGLKLGRCEVPRWNKWWKLD